MFDPDRFVAECRAAAAEDASHKAVREVVARAVAEPGHSRVRWRRSVAAAT